MSLLGVLGLILPALAQAPSPAAERLAQAIRIPTVSYPDPAQVDPAAFAALRAHLEQSFPAVHQALTREVLGDALLYTWVGRDPSLPPLLLAAHQDVVPVEPGTEALWPHPPFSGAIADGAIWGRGALDDKMALMGLLESCEALLGQGFQPQRTVLLAFGADEERSGRAGAAQIAALLASRGVRPYLVLDEGLVVTHGIVPAVDRPVALVGVSEKGYLSVSLTARGDGGHSSMPPEHSAVGRLSQAIVNLEAHPMPAALTSPASDLFEAIAPYATFPERLFFKHTRLFGGILRRALEKKPSTNASLRTTTAATMFEGSPKDNVLPATATAVVNFRIHPRDSVEAVLAHVREVVDDPSIEIAPLDTSIASEPSPLSPSEGPAWELLKQSIQATFPEVVVAPSLMIGATDARYYTGLSPNVYRFAPLRMTSEDLKRLHGAAERITLDHYAEAISFYTHLIRAGAGG